MVDVRAYTAYPLSTAGPRVRIDGYRPSLSRLGISLQLESNLTDAEYALVASPAPRRTKAVVVARGMRRAFAVQPNAEGLFLVHRLLSLTAIPRVDPPRSVDVYDFDDALFMSSFGRGSRSRGLLKREAHRWHTYVERARLVIAGNPYLASAAARYARGRVMVIPSCIEPNDYSLRQHAEADTVRVGWIGSASTAHYLGPVLEAFDRLRRRARGPRFQLVVIGARLGYAAPWIEELPWALDSQRAQLCQLDIGAMPLPDDPWTRGKCGYKTLQYFASGVPAIVSPVGIATDLVADGRGLTADTAGEWEKALVELGNDASERAGRGAACRRFVETEYSYQRWGPELVRALVELT